MATHAEQFSVHCTWEVEGNRSITEAVSWTFGTDSPDLEEEITPDNCVLLQPPTSDDHIVPGCQLFVSCPPTHMIHAICILCEAKMAEVYGRHGEYLETVRSRLIDEVDGMVVFRIDVSLRSPPSECCLKGQSVATKGTLPTYSLPSGLSVTTAGAGLDSYLSGQQYASARPNITDSLSTGQPLGVGGAGLTSPFLQEQQQLVTEGSALSGTISSGQHPAAGGVGLSNFLFSGQPLANGMTSSIPERIFAPGSLTSGGVTLTSSISPTNLSVSGRTEFLGPFTPRQPFVAGGPVGSLTSGQPVGIGGTGLAGPLPSGQPMATVGSLTSGQPVGIGGTGLTGPLTSGQTVGNGRMGLPTCLTHGQPVVTAGTGYLSSQPVSSEGATSVLQQPLVTEGGHSAQQKDVLEHLLTALQQLKTGSGSYPTPTSPETQKESSPPTRDQISNKNFHETIQKLEQKFVELIEKQLEEHSQRMTAELQVSLRECFQTCQQQLNLQIKELLEGQLQALENQLSIKFRQQMDDFEQKICCKLDEFTEQLNNDSE
ncbi:uncharacterized protein LOC143253834 isoform X5 [Tachypleus tridentatus]